MAWKQVNTLETKFLLSLSDNVSNEKFSLNTFSFSWSIILSALELQKFQKER